MTIETERKYLIDRTDIFDIMHDWATKYYHESITQGYIATGPATVRVRLIDDVDAILTVKGPSKNGSCLEVETYIDIEDAKNMLALDGVRTIHKTRYTYFRDDDTPAFVVDFFHGPLEGLVIMEVELEDIYQKIDLPFNKGIVDVTGNSLYTNLSLSKMTYFDGILE